MGAALYNYDFDVSQTTLHALKLKLEGDRKRVESGPPEVWVTIIQLVLEEEEGKIVFSPASFTLNGLRFKTFVEVVGRKRDFVAFTAKRAARGSRLVSAGCAASAVASKGAAVVSKGATRMRKMSICSRDQASKDKKETDDDSELQVWQAVACTGAALMSKLVGGGDEEREAEDDHQPQTCTGKVDVTVDMFKKLGAEDVGVVVRDLKTDRVVAEKIMHSYIMRRVIETAISRKASMIAARLADKNIQKYGLT